MTSSWDKVLGAAVLVWEGGLEGSRGWEEQRRGVCKKTQEDPGPSGWHRLDGSSPQEPRGPLKPQACPREGAEVPAPPKPTQEILMEVSLYTLLWVLSSK